MSDLVQMGHDKNEIPQKSTQPYKCTWMARWMRASRGSTSAAHNQISLQHESREENRCAKPHLVLAGPEIGAESSGVLGEFREVSKGKMIDYVDESLATRCGKLRDDAFEGPAPVMLKMPRNTGSILALEKGECSSRRQYLPAPQIGTGFAYDESSGGIQNHSSSLFALASNDAEIQSREFCLQPEGISLTPELQDESDKLFGKNTLAGLPYSQENHLRSISKVVPYESNSRIPMHPLFSYRGKNQSGAALVAHQKKADTGATLLVHDPSVDTDQLRAFIGRPFKKMLNCSEVELFPSQMSPPDTRNLKSPHYKSYALTRMPSSAHDVEAMRICATVDSVEEYHKVPQKFSQTTRQFFFTRKTDVNLFDGGQLFRESILAVSEGKKVNEFPCLLPDFTFHIKQGLKLQPLGSFIESARKEDAEHFKTSTHDLENELSVETDTMDMDAFQNNYLFGVAPSQSNKDIKVGQKPLTFDAAVASTGGEISGKHLDTEVPDINQELPMFPGLTSFKNDLETSSSRTQSLDVEHFLSHAERPANVKAGGDGSDGSLGLDPCSRWVKRLKSSASGSFAYGTKSSRLEEASSHEKVGKLFSKILECTKTTSEQKMNESSHKDQITVDPTAEELRKAEFSSVDSGKKSEDVKLQHAWIQRWCHRAAASPEQKSEMVMACKPHRSKSILHDIQKEHFPSIAAIALMGKVMTGFPPFELRKRGSSVVWNTQKCRDELS